MRQEKYFCDHCGNEVRNGNALRKIIFQRFSWARDLTFGVCEKCIKDIENYVGTARHTKPPLGLVPRFVRDSERCREILAAIERYNDAGKPVPGEWLEELNERMPKQRAEGGGR